jgi:hypothetical protein
MKIATASIILLFCYQIVFSQKTLPASGHIEMAELKMKQCAFETDAGAARLIDEQKILFEQFFTTRITTEKRVRIKIFNEKGYENATIHIPYFGTKQKTKIRDLTGAVYNLDSSGNIITTKIDEKDFYKEKVTGDIHFINFTFPNVKSGCIIEYSYKKIENDISIIDTWIPQDDIPTVYAVTVINASPDLQIKEKIFGIDSLVNKMKSNESASNSRKKKVYEIDNLPSFHAEPFMSCEKDNLLKVLFNVNPENILVTQNMATTNFNWEYFGYFLMRHSLFGGQFDKELPDSKPIVAAAKQIFPVSRRIQFLYDTVQKIIYTKTQQIFYAEDIVEAWNNKTANSTELNIILLDLLRKSDVTCYPILISTRQHGKINMDFPSLGQLDGMDILAEDSTKSYFIDAYSKHQSVLIPPLNVLNRDGILLEGNGIKWVPITNEKPLIRRNISILASLNTDGSLTGTAVSNYYDHAKFLLDSSGKKNENYFFVQRSPDLKIISKNFDAGISENDPITEQLEFTYEPEITNDFYFINPQFFFFDKKNPFVQKTRNTDIDFVCNQVLNFTFRFKIPPSFQIEQLPQNIIVRAPDSSFYLKRTFYTDSTEILLKQTFEIKKATFERDQYPALKDFFTRVFSLTDEQIVLKKKN